ncbi:MAG: pyridoxamine 5'-phosphate oxidase family protein [Candidatus Hodarchaeales archaeon]|jgi:nitroimidazol reductase NimA-like FMN-containing flavoprotein (pyridoxamine 5'-phosphate oxidase superfamily)
MHLNHLSFESKNEINEYEAILKGNNIAHLATISPNGIPHSVPVWFSFEFEHGILKFNTYENSQKDKNLKENTNISISICNAANPYNYLHIIGKVFKREIDIEGKFGNFLTQKYSNYAQKIYPIDKSKNLLIYSILPTKITGWKEKSANNFLSWLTD